MSTTIAPWAMKTPALSAEAELAIAEIAARRAISAPAQQWISGSTPDTGSYAGGLSFSTAQQQSAWVYACVQAIAEEIANLPFRFSLGQRKGENILERGDFIDLFSNPHAYINKFELWEFIVGWLLLRGKCFVVGFDNAGNLIRWRNRMNLAVARPATLYILNPDRMTKQCYGGHLAFWRYYTASDEPAENYRIQPDEVLFLRLPLLGDFYEGLAPLAVALLTARGDYTSKQFMRGLMENNADQGLVTTTDGTLSAEQRLQIEASLRGRKRRVGRADAPLILEGGLKVEKPSISMVDLQYLEILKFNRQEICAVFRVPQEIIGFTEDANRSVSQSMRLSFIQFRILTLAARLEAFVDPIPKAFDKNLYGWFDDDSHPVMIAARRERWDGAVKAFSIGVPIEECSKQFDLGLPGGLKHEGKSYLPFSLQEVGVETERPGDNLAEEESPTSEVQSPKSAAKKAAADIDRLLGRLAEAKNGEVKTPLPQLPPVESSETCSTPGSNEYASSIAGSVKIKQGRLKKFFFEQQIRVVKSLSAQFPQTEGARSLPYHEGLIEGRAFENLLDLLAENKVLWQRISPLLRTDVEFGVAQIAHELNLDDFKVPPMATINALRDRQKVIESMNQTTFDQLKDSLSEGLTDGETFHQLTSRVKEIYKDATQSRAESVALTETNVAVNSGRWEGMRAAGVEKKGWQTSNLSGVRATHLQAERDYADGIGIDDSFVVGGEQLRFPGDPAGSPGNTINCRCFTFAILDEKSAPALAGKHILTYEQWVGRAAPAPPAKA